MNQGQLTISNDLSCEIREKDWHSFSGRGYLWKIAWIIQKKGLVSKVRQPSSPQMENGNTSKENIWFLFINNGIQLYPDTNSKLLSIGIKSSKTYIHIEELF